VRSEGMRCILYNPEYSISRRVLLLFSVVVTLERTSLFHLVLAAAIMGSKSQVGSSSAIYWQALWEEINETPMRDFRFRVLEGKLNNPPILFA